MKLINLLEAPFQDDITAIYGASHADYINLLVSMAVLHSVTETNQISYILATAKHETGDFEYLYEQPGAGDPVEYFNAKYSDRIDLGNTPGTDDGYNYRGRGFVHITGGSGEL